MNKKIKIGFSPCPNDTFMFHALVHKLVDTEGLEFDIILADVEELNRKAFNEDLDVTKISYHALGILLNKYYLLNTGSALGKNCGPILISKKEVSNEAEFVNPLTIAIPGKYTTANFLLSIAYPDAKNKFEIVFSDIENFVLNGKFDAGVIIHENRFTYQEKGLNKIIDLGEYWEETTNSLIPLGGIAASRNLPSETINKFERVLKRSIEYAFDNPSAAITYIRKHAQEMEEEVMYNHIRLYVNRYSIELGYEGQEAVRKMFLIAQEKGIIPIFEGDFFAPPL
ncbi:MAG: 1,4-dihydroxy-6-naphthoate synthase [Bacteroidetes bacterium]|nr:1,4-dihydroxy-6-naphthoate synthase [Bacteroidota bacterium]MBV6461817.1 1,4-dihydroxy-6-naphtoate synthase [Flavobacteriales bacterium]WKZ75931.1 MAG: 1,4-dihydroxy-6-naphthoate synthase [Vicingaceae bacterium]MCL4816689.1 1,4-dihydroxy-6-naphthoate synthase [Flavobacteriales bacterium]NOG95609.1 1,4-dihydroxy-6-naphthoate synthase [Bacteroidota bacterium]